MLEHLVDISAKELGEDDDEDMEEGKGDEDEDDEDDDEEESGFRLTFTFEPNEFFSETVLVRRVPAPRRSFCMSDPMLGAHCAVLVTGEG